MRRRTGVCLLVFALLIMLTCMIVKAKLHQPFSFEVIDYEGETYLHVVNNSDIPLTVKYVVVVNEDGVQDMKQGPRVTADAVFYSLQDLNATNRSQVFVCYTYGKLYRYDTV